MIWVKKSLKIFTTGWKISWKWQKSIRTLWNEEREIVKNISLLFYYYKQFQQLCYLL